ncbi:MAG: LysM peptidoglycan-binding domain-containing protein [Bacteroidia bacterium]|nr:MAG: LysM peptidoglycan-binding domain-containing protein [Bacteroidia bacterium]
MNKALNMSVKQIILVLSLFFTMLAPAVLMGQEPVPVEISRQKIVVEGKVWFMHKVLKGQTLYSISKAYNVTINDITSANVITGNGIQESQILRIPEVIKNQQSSANAPATQAKPPATVTPTTTRQENVSAHEAKPTQQQTNTSVRQTDIPSRQVVSEVLQDDKFIYHRVAKGETLSSLSRLYGISVRDLKKANKGLLYPREGEYLKIPRRKMSEETLQKIPEPVADTARTVQADTLMIFVEPDTLATEETSVIERLRGSVRVEVLLPFFLRENSIRSYIDSTRTDSRGSKIYKEVFLPEEWIYDASLPFVEMYEGMLIAIDSLRTLGVEVEINVSDTGADTVAVNRLITSGRLRNADLIIGPVYSYNLQRVASYAAEYGIPVVSPVQLRDQRILDGNPTLFRLCPSTGVAQDIIVNEVATHHNSNVVFLYSDSLMIYPQTTGFWERLTAAIRPDGISDSTLLTSHYYTGLIPRNDTHRGISSLEPLLRGDRENIIILGTTLTPKVSAAMATLHTLSRKYDIKLFGYPEIGDLETIDLRYFYDLELIILSESYIDYSRAAVNDFLRIFHKKFMTEPTAQSFAWRGFDMAYYFIGGLALEGRTFIQSLRVFNPELLSYDFGFIRAGFGSGFENRHMYILHYKDNMTISVTNPTVIMPSLFVIPKSGFSYPRRGVESNSLNL